MRKVLIVIILCLILPGKAFAMEYTAPELEGIGETYMPEDTESFAEGVWKIFTQAVEALQPSIAKAAKSCVGVIAAALILTISNSVTGSQKQLVEIVGTVLISCILFGASDSLVSLAVTTVKELSSYGQLLLPVMTSAMASQGAVTTSGALYVGTAVFDSVLTSAIAGLMTPLVYIYLVLSIASCAFGERSLVGLRDQVKWLVTWALKIALYIFMGYMGITRVISGSADAAAVKATKLTISGMVPVVGGILSDASETILVSAGLIKNAVGIYGMLAVIAIWIEPFLLIGSQYLLLKGTSTVCEMIGAKNSAALVKSFSSAMGLLLAMTGAVCLMLLVSVICFMKGVT